MKNAKLGLIGAIVISGCGDRSPDRVCGQVMAVTVRTSMTTFLTRHPNASKKEIDEVLFPLVTGSGRTRTACVAKLKEVRSQDSRAYKEQARCVMKAADVQALNACGPFWRSDDQEPSRLSPPTPADRRP